MSDSSQKKKLKLSIELTPKEQQICDLLKDVVKKRNLNTTMRVAGGWVRDKLLGLNSDDIDIALDNMMGKEFAEHVNEHMKQLGHKTGSIGVIKLNPEQSKHLETATVNLFEVWVDFVNLRSESYEADSRIPDKISFGTPSQDAHRRDITINSLFYNINEDNIEDFTEKGIVDLQDGIIRTPLDPIVTFSDDPLRCLRVIRFAGRFNFEIENATYRALSSDVSRNGIKSKISRERIGKEVDKMLKDLNGSIAVYHLHQTDLFDVVFQPHPSTTPLENASIEGTKTSRCAYWAMATKASGLEIDQEEKRLMFFSTAMVSYRSATFVDKKQKVSSQPSYMVLESLKLPVKDAKAVTAILESVEEFKALAQNVSGYTRKQLGLAIKKPAENWKISLMVALSHEVSPLLENIDPKEQVQISDDAAAAAICKRYQNLVENVTTLQLLDCWNDKPLLNGKEISSLLSLQAGPSLGKYIHDLLEWQLEFPAATVEEAKTWLLEHKNKQGSTSN